MSIATWAALCWMSLVATDPAGTNTLISGHEGETSSATEQGVVTPRFEIELSSGLEPAGQIGGTFEVEVECCSGLESLGRILLSAVGVECAHECCETASAQCEGFTAAQCEPECCLEISGELAESNSTLECEGIRLYQVGPSAGGAASFRIAEVPAVTRCNPESCPAPVSVTGEACAECPHPQPGACHVGEFNVVVGQPQSPAMVQVYAQPFSAAQCQEAPWINAFVIPSPPRAVYAAPQPRIVQWIAPGAQPQPGWAAPGHQPIELHDRISHLQEAARHLEAAGMPGEAHALRQQSTEMEQHARRMLEEKEAQLQQLEREVEALRQVVHGHNSDSAVMINSSIFRVSPQGLAAIQEHCPAFGAGSVSRHDFQPLLERLQNAGMVEMLATPRLVTMAGERAGVQCGLPSLRPVADGTSCCELSIRPTLHEGCCRLELQPQLRTTGSAGLRLQSAHLTAELDPSQGLLVQLSDDGSVLAFLTWEHVQSPQPTAAVPPPVTSQPVRALVPASAALPHPPAAIAPFTSAVPAQGQIMVRPLLPQPFPGRVPQDVQSLHGFAVPPAPIPSAAAPSNAPR
jgi:hypothetical protein